MSKLEELETAVKALPIDDYRKFRDWIAEFDDDQWNLQIEKDSQDKDSPISRLAQNALEEHSSREEKLEWLKRELAIGCAQADRGEFVKFDLETELPRWREKLAARKKNS